MLLAVSVTPMLIMLGSWLPFAICNAWDSSLYSSIALSHEYGPPTPNTSRVQLRNAATDSLTFSYTLIASECPRESIRMLQLTLKSCAAGTSFATHYNATIAGSICPPKEPLTLVGNHLRPNQCYIASLKFVDATTQSYAIRIGSYYYFTVGTKPNNSMHFNQSLGFQFVVDAESITMDIPFLQSDCSANQTRLLASLYYDNDTIVPGNSNKSILCWDNCRYPDTIANAKFQNLQPMTFYKVNFQTLNVIGTSEIIWFPESIQTEADPPTHYQPKASDWTIGKSEAAKCGSKLSHKMYFNFDSSWFNASNANLTVTNYEVVVVANDSLVTENSTSLMKSAQNTTFLSSESMQLPFVVSNTVWNPFNISSSDPCCVLDTEGLCQSEGGFTSEEVDRQKSPGSSSKIILIGGLDCANLASNSLCVGDLPIRNYSILIRAYENYNNQTLHSDPILLAVSVVAIKRKNSGRIAGIVIGAIAGILLILLLLYLLTNNYRSEKEKRRKKRIRLSQHTSSSRASSRRNSFTLTIPATTPTPNNSPELKDSIKFGFFRQPVKMVLPGEAQRGIEPPRIPPPIRVENFAAKVTELLKDDGLLCMDELELMDSLSPTIPVNRDLTSDQQITMSKNRFLNVLPFDFNRVILSSGESDYINASFIKGQNHEHEYIAAQGPMGPKCTRPNHYGNSREKVQTVDDFWRMIWEQGVEVIVMLTQCQEKAASKCAHYWPESVNTMETHDCFLVRMLSESTNPSYVYRILEVADMSDPSTKRRIHHLHFLNWADFEAPSEPLQLMDFLKLMHSCVPKGSLKPKLVHCSAGVGRTGTFIAIDLLLQRLEKSMDYVDVFKCVLELREQRVFMVKTEKQYALIYRCLNSALSRKMEEQRLKEEDGLGEPAMTSAHSDSGMPSEIASFTSTLVITPSSQPVDRSVDAPALTEELDLKDVIVTNF